MTILNLYQLDPKLAAKIREVIATAAHSSKPPLKKKLQGVLEELDEAYRNWEEIDGWPESEPETVEPFDPFDL
jgi:hypothetical protein